MAPNTRYEWLRKNLDYGDYEEMSELLEKIDNLNITAEDVTFSYFLKQSCSPYILDWINYTNLKKHLDDQETILAKEHVVQISKTDESEQNLLATKFINDSTTLKLDILNTFNAYTPEMRDIIEHQKNYLKIKEIKNKNLIINPLIENEYRTYTYETEDQIKKMENSFEHNSLKLMFDSI